MRKAIGFGLALVALVCTAEPGNVTLSPENWTVLTPEAKVASDGTLRLDGRKKPTYAFYHAASYGDVSLEARYSVSKTEGVMAVGFVIASTDSASFLGVHYDRWSAILSEYSDCGALREIKRVRKAQDSETWYSAKLVRKGKTLEVFFNDAKLYDAEVPDTPGRVGFYASQTIGTIQDIRISGTAVPLAKPWENAAEGRIHGAPKEQARAEILWTKALCKEPGRYIGWPTVCRTKGGDLFAVFSGDRDEHVCPWGKAQMIRSTDGGKTWGAPVNICNTILDDRDSGIIELNDGTLVMAWFTSIAYRSSIRDRAKLTPGSPQFYWWLHDEKLRPAEVEEQLGAFTRRSTDGGKTWEAAVRTPCSTPHGPIQLKDGRLLYVGKSGDADHLNLGAGIGKIVAAESRDQGRSWQVIGEIPHPALINILHDCHEPHAVETTDGRIVAQIRCENRKDGFYGSIQSESSDGGKTWTEAKPVGLDGFPPHLIRLADGKLLSVYGRRWGHFGEFACLSDDQGRTWDVQNEIKLAGHWNGDLGYPASVQLPDGTILTVYYQAETQGEKTCLIGTLWRVRK